MNELTVSVLIRICLIISVTLIALGIYVRWCRTDIRLHNRTMAVRSLFGKARHELMLAAMNGEVDCHSQTFQVLYSFQTAVLRRPDKYDRLALDFIRAQLSKDAPSSSAIIQEMHGWSPSIRVVIGDTAMAMRVLIQNCSRVIRFLRFLERNLQALTIARFALARFAGVFRWLARKENPDFSRAAEVEGTLLELASA